MQTKHDSNAVYYCPDPTNVGFFFRFLPLSFRRSLSTFCISQIEAQTSPRGNPPPGIWIFLKILFKFPTPEAGKLFKCPIIGPFQVIKCPHPWETFQ